MSAPLTPSERRQVVALLESLVAGPATTVEEARLLARLVREVRGDPPAGGTRA